MSKRVLVLGGKGFIGRHAVRFLREHGADVTVGTRMSDPSSGLTEINLPLHQRTDPSDWISIIRDFDVVLNCVGILRQRFQESYDDVHHLAPVAIARACADAGVRFVHVSAMGLSDQARSRFLTSKLRGERAIEQVEGDWCIVRISLLDGEGGYGASWLRAVSRLPMFVVPASARGEIAALTADDAGEALSRICLMSSDTPSSELPMTQTVIELGGNETYTFRSYIEGLRRRHTQRSSLCLVIPGWLSRIGAHLCDLFHFSPFSFGHWELLCRDNRPHTPHLEMILGRPPTPVIDRRGPAHEDTSM
ncbi:MAG: NAD-dependent epimerase/dehydratase family protein [Pseudomonadota bacterium]